MVNYKKVDNLLIFKTDSWINEVHYNITDGSLKIFSGKTMYKCQDVPLSVFEEFDAAPSKGRYFNLYIKGQYLDNILK